MTHFRTHRYAPLALLALLACSKAGDATKDTTAAEAAAAATATPAAAEASSQSGPITQAEVRRYRLTTANVRAMHEAEMSWIGVAKPTKESDDGDDAGDITKDATTTDGANEMLREIEKDPATVAAIRKAGTTPRQVAIHTLVAAMSSIFAAAGGADLPPDIAPENVAFAKEHMAELQRMQKEREAAMEKRKQGQ